jgi:hypothetical protein
MLPAETAEPPAVVSTDLFGDCLAHETLRRQQDLSSASWTAGAC